ncbi:c-type cytochrome [Maribacter polysaccharolyticus]|uniref:c-type cytochrome n=1 Tax=Maribacter polysaccharolyticus TaxID=3020831 RepID=UPI00237F8063|nr:c-type cytochrome [Maribacter polysaccharolyticus]MDE3741490.1 PQQ-dependent sugar dehydrogenase [Maribacter polysaccharolyticus]
MKRNVIKPMIFVLLVGGSLLVFYPNRLTRYAKRKIRAYTTAPKGTLEAVLFQKIELNEGVKGQFTSLVMAPDHKLYASAIDGKIMRFLILPTGNLVLEHTFKPFGEASKLTIGLALDPDSRPDSLIFWTTHSETPTTWVSFPDAQKALDNTNWAGSISRMHLSSSTDQVLKVEVVLKDLPRFGPNQENFTNSILFGPDGKLYFGQGANTGMGWCDCEENQQPSREALLSGAILCLDPHKLPQELPLSVKTPDGGGSYDPYGDLAPLKIYATGLRNAYDLVWHSNGQLYATINGSGGNENTPSSDPKSPYYIRPFPAIDYTGPRDIPAVIGAQPDQNDFMARVEQNGYYGHPNPLRAEYVLNHGDADVENHEYNGVAPDANFRGFSYDFGPHIAPTGLMEYKSETFNGRLKGCLIVARLGRNDLVVVRPGGETLDIENDYDGATMGLEVGSGPLDVVEDEESGNLYVSEFGNRTITLFHPIEKESDRLVQDKMNRPKEIKDQLEEGRVIYEQNCQICHGAEGQGAIGPNLMDGEWIYGKEKMVQTIENGSGKGTMPAWKHTLSTNEIKWVESYVLSLGKTEGL